MKTLWLIPLDGSEQALRALDLAVQEAQARIEKPHLLALHVEPSLSSNITRFIDRATVDDYHRENGDKVLQPARDQLAASGLEHSTHLLVGECAPTIVEFARDKGCQMIVMGARGTGGTIAGLLGSVTSRVIHLSPMSVLLVH
jgi:nucleotide-binding universal stress UspA family protein